MVAIVLPERLAEPRLRSTSRERESRERCLDSSIGEAKGVAEGDPIVRGRAEILGSPTKVRSMTRCNLGFTVSSTHNGWCEYASPTFIENLGQRI